MAAGSLYPVQRLGLAEPGPVEAIEGDQGETDHRHDETTGHVILVSDVTHQFGQDRTAHDGHDDVGGCPFRPGTQTDKCRGRRWWGT